MRSRDWAFKSSDSSIYEALAEITNDGAPKILAKKLLGVKILKPATLVLKNVNQSYNGSYQFALKLHRSFTSDVTVFITRKFLSNLQLVVLVNKIYSDCYFPFINRN